MGSVKPHCKRDWCRKSSIEEIDVILGPRTQRYLNLGAGGGSSVSTLLSKEPHQSLKLFNVNGHLADRVAQSILRPRRYLWLVYDICGDVQTAHLELHKSLEQSPSLRPEATMSDKLTR